ncbi:MAG: hypothetical protein WA821_21035 [Anaerolineales bacterium]
MSILKTNISEYLLGATVAIDNVSASPEVQALLAEVGYDAARLAAGKALLTRASALNSQRGSEKGDQVNATSAKDAAWQQADDVYIKQVKLARIAVKKPGDRGKLMLEGDRKRKFAGWVEQASAFYEHAFEPDILAQLGTVNLGQAKLQDGKALTDAVIAAHMAQATAIGDKENATDERDQAFDDLAAWMSDYLAAARIALEDHPQWMEKLGVLARTTPKAKPSAAKSPVTNSPAA